MAESIVWHDVYRRPIGEEVTLMWYDEGKDYDFDTLEFDPEAAQFTQLIWKATGIFGIAYAEYEPEDNPGYVKTVTVANYYPGGNVEGKFKYNVQEGKTHTAGGYSSKIQRKIELYQKKKARQSGKSILTGKTKPYFQGNLG